MESPDHGTAEIGRRYRLLLEELAREGVRLVPKAEVWHQRLIAWLLALLTLGGQRHYLDGFVTTIGRTIYLTPDWEQRPVVDRYATLRHERVHVAQFRRYGLLPMALAYLLLPLPMGLSWCRMRLERAAYEETLRVHHALGGRAAVLRLREHVIAQFISANYAWMWPFEGQVARWFDDFVARL